MAETQVHIDFHKMEKALKLYVRRKAQKSGSRIIYVEKGQLIEENPRTHTRSVVKQLSTRD